LFLLEFAKQQRDNSHLFAINRKKKILYIVALTFGEEDPFSDMITDVL
jgi:hypothetical protein